MYIFLIDIEARARLDYIYRRLDQLRRSRGCGRRDERCAKLRRDL